MANSDISNILLRLINSISEGLNKHCMPRMIVFPLDDDVITGLVKENKPEQQPW